MLYNYSQYLKENILNNNYNNMVDYTFLKVDTTLDRIREMCKTAQENKYYSVCVMPDFVSDAYGFLEDDDIKIVTVINYPEGKNKSEQNIKDITTAISEGADEIDFVLDYNLLKQASVLEDILDSKVNSGDVKSDEVSEEQDKIDRMYQKIEDKVKDVSAICHKNSIVIKCIIESGELTLDQIRKACSICDRAGVDYVMTSTGVSEKGAELDKVIFMRKILPEYIKIKVSGGIRTTQDVDKFYKYADRFGTSVILKTI